ncbi:c-type cytochrome [Roseateles albus]|uniref:Cytochrome c n=1 Tax=Roseateles albus TaxID=2987525 RepID=A0ABT5KF26_9BURK|nr:cytochrome c [Roseateles albus]MDC8772522.1 cytochrome c [Roseateles albus]
MRTPYFSRLQALPLGMALCGVSALAEPLPTPAALQELLKAPPQAVKVIEPHLSIQGEPSVQRAYLGYPAAQVLRQLLGVDWNKAPASEIEFRALDGFVARIPAERFAKYHAYLVFGLAEPQAPFSVDNKAQGEKDVPLGPYYLVWDNLAAPELLAEGGAQWPYQVAQISLRQASPAVLLPAGMSSEQWGEQAALAQKFCLSCHQINGFGGDKMPLNLAVRAKLLDERTWRVWLLTPLAFKPRTSMPALPDSMAPAEREAIAAKLHAYLKALPVLP